MDVQEYHITNANKAVAHIAYMTNEVCPIYPITPASEMAELVEEWSAKEHENVFQNIPLAYTMQSEAGVAGAMHGALQTGSLAATFTASQGLLLMLPNMYKIAGQLLPNVIHVATRAIATHALSIFGDHSDVMAVRSSGYALLASNSVQEAQDFALIAQCASLRSKIPFLHFFDGFRTSHEVQRIATISDNTIDEMLPQEDIQNFRERALTPDAPVMRGTSQTADTFFQGREATNPFYLACPDIVEEQMNRFFALTGRNYRLFDYVGDPNAEYILIAMASATETIEETLHRLNAQGQHIGLIKVHLYRPFSKKHLLRALPKNCTRIAVLDRTKEPGAAGEPLFLDVSQAVTAAYHAKQLKTLPLVIGGRYGLSSKEFTPAMVSSIIDNLCSDKPKTSFTVGITDNVTYLSLPNVKIEDLQNENFQALFFGYQETNFLKKLGELPRTTTEYEHLQWYTEFDYDKANTRKVHHLRLSATEIKAPYLIQRADVVACNSVACLINDNALDRVKEHGAVLVISTKNEQDFWEGLPQNLQRKIQDKRVNLYLMPQHSQATQRLLEAVPQLIAKDFLLKDNIALTKVNTTGHTATKEKEDIAFDQTFLGKLLIGKGNEIIVGDFPFDGTYPTNTSELLVHKNDGALPVWDADACTQCGACSMACPQAAIRVKVYDDVYLPDTGPWKSKKATWLGKGFEHSNYTVQVNPAQCTACNLCVDSCVVDALEFKDSQETFEKEKKQWNHFKSIPEFDRTKLDTTKVSQQQLQEPLFKYSRGEEGCGQAPYLKLLSQLFGDRLLVSNATGASSIFGGALPTTPWAQNNAGRGPAWANSLFEDNAEFGMGFQFSQLQKTKQAKKLLYALEDALPYSLVNGISNASQNTETQIEAQRTRIAQLKSFLKTIESTKALQLLDIADSLVNKSIWIVGGDGWAYDIGFGGLDHALASGENINILVLDNEVYSNTGGQMSKATPYGASAKFTYNGKTKKKKDLGKIAMTYESVYVASVAMGADKEQMLKAFNEAAAFEGPSLILAYCHSPAHGIDMKSPSKHQKAAVASGHWPLYRFDPRRSDKGLPAYQEDAGPHTITQKAFMAMEQRFAKTLSKESTTKGVLESSVRLSQEINPNHVS